MKHRNRAASVPCGKHPVPLRAFKSVAADEVGVLLRKVAETAAGKNLPGRPSSSVGGLPTRSFGATGDAGAHDVLAEIVADVAAGICQAIGVQPGFGEQEQARGLERGGGQYDHLGPDGVVLPRFRIDEVHAAGFAGLRIDGDFTDRGIGAQRKVAGVHRPGKSSRWGNRRQRECRSRLYARRRRGQNSGCDICCASGRRW